MIKIAWHLLFAHPLPEGHRFSMVKYELIPKQLLSKAACEERDRMVLQFYKGNNLPVQGEYGRGYSPDIKDIVDAHCNTFRVGIDIFE